MRRGGERKKHKSDREKEKSKKSLPPKYLMPKKKRKEKAKIRDEKQPCMNRLSQFFFVVCYSCSALELNSTLLKVTSGTI